MQKVLRSKGAARDAGRRARKIDQLELLICFIAQPENCVSLLLPLSLVVTEFPLLFLFVCMQYIHLLSDAVSIEWGIGPVGAKPSK